MCEKFNCDLDDPKIVEMDPFKKVWYYNSWMEKQSENAELGKNIAYLIGSFIDPEKVKDLLNVGNKHVSTNEEFEETTNMVKEMIAKDNLDNKNKKRNRKARI